MKENRDNKKFWDRNASLYDASRRSEKVAYDTMIDRIRALLRPDMNVLELATGTGIIALRIADCCGKIEATDFSEEMIKVAQGKEKPENVTFSVADATDLPYIDRQFDAVIISNALHIIYPDSFTTLPKNEAFSEMMDEIRNTMEHFDYQEHEGHFDHALVRQPSIITYFEQAAKLIRDAGFTARLDDETDEILEIRNEYGRHVEKVDGYSASTLFNGLMPDDLNDAIHNLRLTIPFENDPERESGRLAALQEQQEAGSLITKDNIEIDRELFIEDDHINAYVAAWFDVDSRFGTETHGTDDYLNVYANYYPETEELEVGYTLIKSDGSDNDFKAVKLADSEKDAILAKMKEAGLDECIAEMNEDQDSGMSIQ